MRTFAPVAALAGLALLIAGCGSSSGSTTSTASSSSSSSNASQGGGDYGGGYGKPKTTTSSAGATTGGGQTVKLTGGAGGSIAFDKSTLHAKAGKVTIVMANAKDAGIQHGIAVEGKGVDKDGTPAPPGGTSTVTVTLKRGTYEFYCPVDGHRQQGMEGKLVVS